MKAYNATQVNYMKSQAKIGMILSREGILDKQFTHLGSQKKLVLIFKKSVSWENKLIPLGVRIEIEGVPVPEDTKSLNECNRKHRVLYHWLKTKFEAINEGLYEDITQGFVKEFYPNLLLGNKTIMERTLPEFTNAFLEGKTDVNLQLENKG